MKLYAELPTQRSRQAFFDLFLVAWCWAWIRVGMYMNDLVEKLSAAGRMLIDAGKDLEGTASSVQGTVVRVPVLGSFLKERFDGLVGVGQSLQDSGNSQVATVDTLSSWVGVIVALLPILLALTVWLWRRAGWIRDASAAARLREDPENLYLFALRAISNRPLTELRTKDARQAIRAFHTGDYAPLARLELKEMGLRYR
ncbi:MAG TPA: hypothetical protein VFV09_07265 [Actinomycetota bacterium]|jgi:hypothetical protein|nr:hypothetical protein [Actinomycetota bacterium]